MAARTRRILDVLQWSRAGDRKQDCGANSRIRSGFCHFSPVLSRCQYGSRRRTIHRRIFVLSGYKLAMIEYIDGPCCWSQLAPTRLRRQAYGGISTWKHYSTAGFLDGSDPRIIHTTEFPDLEVRSSIQIELLSGKLTKRWQRTGLHFANYADVQDINFPEALDRSLDLIRMVQPLLGTVSGLCRSLHLLKASDIEFDSSYSDPLLPFSIFVSCPSTTEVNRIERLTESIVHEALHLQLSLVETIEPLIIDQQQGNHLYSPWRNELRTIHGLVHGVYVFGNLRYFWKCIAAQLSAHSSFAEARVRKLAGELATASDLESNPALTPMGRRLATSLLYSQ